MSDKARQTLKMLVEKHGHDLASQPKRVQGFLLDLCAEKKRETKVLVEMVQKGLAEELARDGGRTPMNILLPRQVDRLHQESGIDLDLAHWAVKSWAMSLELLTERENANHTSDSNYPKKYKHPNNPILRRLRDVLRSSQKTRKKSTEQTFNSQVDYKEVKSGDLWREPVTGMEFVFVPEGSFEMGDVLGVGDYTANPVHTVKLDGFWLGKYPVTQSEWKKIMGYNPSFFQLGPDFPVEKVSWHDSQNFIEKLNARSNRTFHLPTEAEWEYAARSAGKKQKYAGGYYVDKVAWYAENSGGQTHKVGTKSPNGLRLYDMSGNVCEWCKDKYDSDAYSRHSSNNPLISSGGSLRVNRGGSWGNVPRNLRVFNREGADPNKAFAIRGLRLCLPQSGD